jgi:hypothetical protein
LKQDGSGFIYLPPAVSQMDGAAVAWIATDLDGRADVGLTKEEAKRRAGEGCTEFIPLFDLGDAATTASVIEVQPGHAFIARPGTEVRHVEVTTASANGPCAECGGNGKLWSVRYECKETCDACNGTGRATAPSRDADGSLINEGTIAHQGTSQAPLDKEAEKQKFIAWGQIFHRNARRYTARDFDHGFLAWLAAKSDAALARAPLPVQGDDLAGDLAWHKEALKRYVAKLEAVWEGIREAVQKYTGKPCEGEPFSRLDELLSRLAAPAQEGDARDAARYRWLRHAINRDDTWPSDVANAVTGEELEAAIDAAMSASQDPTPEAE